MTSEEFARLVRAIGEIIGEKEVTIVGSQAILGSYRDTSLPAEATRSNEIDAVVADHRQAGAVRKLLGPGSLNEIETKIWVDVVSAKTAHLPSGWHRRRVSMKVSSAPLVYSLCPEPNDLAASKLIAFRLQDTQYVAALLVAQILDIEILATRVKKIDGLTPGRRSQIEAWLAAQRQRNPGNRH
jgi:hypothetical protein